MADRLGRAARLHNVQARKRDLAEWRLAQVRRETAEVERVRADLLASSDGDLALHGLFVDLLSRGVQAADRRLARLREREEKMRDLAAAEKRRARMAELLHRKIAVEAARRAADRALLDILETAAQSRSQASEKLRGR